MINSYISILAIFLCFLPFLLLFWRKMGEEKVFLMVCIYWSITGFINMPQYLPASLRSEKLEENITLIDNMLDTPLMILIFYFSASGLRKSVLKYILLGFIFFEAVMIFWKGHNFDSNTVIIGVGTFFSFGYSLWRMADYFQKMEHTVSENTMVFVYASFVFYFGIFQIIWVFNYLNYHKETVAENLFLYYLAIILATTITCFGYWRYRNPAYNQPPHSGYFD